MAGLVPVPPRTSVSYRNSSNSSYVQTAWQAYNKRLAKRPRPNDHTLVLPASLVNKIISSVKNSILYKEQAEKYGTIEELPDKAEEKSSDIPTLKELCHKVLVANGYPHAFVDSKESYLRKKN